MHDETRVLKARVRSVAIAGRIKRPLNRNAQKAKQTEPLLVWGAAGRMTTGPHSCALCH